MNTACCSDNASLVPRCFAILIVTLFVASCSKDAPDAAKARLNPVQVSGELVLEQVRKFIAVSPRVSGTDNAASAAKYIADRLRGYGLSPKVDEFTDVVSGSSITFRNVTARLVGDNDNGIIIIASHYDTKIGMADDFTGANDSGSSTGLVLELARIFAGSGWAGPDIMFAFFDGEECRESYGESDGLHGSRRLAGLLKDKGYISSIKAVIVLDMIGDRDLTVTLPRNCSGKLLGLVFETAREEGVRGKFSLSSGAVVDDHVPFHASGVPAVDIIDYKYGSERGKNDFWHTSEDTIDKLSADSLQIIGRIVVRMINRVSTGQDDH